MKKYIGSVSAAICLLVFFAGCAHQGDRAKTYADGSPPPDGLFEDDRENWEKFLKLKERYYYLDKQDFNKISCVIETPMMAKRIEQMREQLEPLQNNIEIKENLASFVLTYSPTSGLDLGDPEFDVQVKNTEGIADPERFKKGIAMVQHGFEQHTDGIKDVLKGIFDDFRYPQKEDYKDLVVIDGEGGSIVKYVRGNSSVVARYFKDTIEVAEEGNGLTIDTTLNYSVTSQETLILQHATVLMDQPSGEIETDFELEYKEIGGVLFPRNIRTTFEYNLETMTQKGAFDINLVDCEIE